MTAVTVCKYLAIMCVVVFSLFGSCVLFYYLRQLYVNRQHTICQIHMKARSKHLFLLSLVVNVYWSSFHPIYIFCYFIYAEHQSRFALTSVYSISLVLLMIVLSINCMRAWILFYNFNYLALQFTKLWQSELLKEHYKLSWYQTHKETFGNIRFLLAISAVCIVILSCLLVPYAYISNLSNGFYIASMTSLYFMIALFVFLVFQLHKRHSADNFGVRPEMTIFMVVITLCSVIGLIIFFFVQDPSLRLFIINIPVFVSTWFIVVYSAKQIMDDIRKHDAYLQSLSSNDVNNDKIEPIKFYELLQHSTGVNEFARFMIGEFSLEHLLFIVEVAQYRAQFDDIIDDEQIQKYKEDIFKISTKIPICGVLQDNPNDAVKQACIIMTTFVQESSSLSINISAKIRSALLCTSLDDSLTKKQLKHLFDSAYESCYRLIDLDSFSRFKNTANAQILLDHIIHKRSHETRKYFVRKQWSTFSITKTHTNPTKDEDSIEIVVNEQDDSNNNIGKSAPGLPASPISESVSSPVGSPVSESFESHTEPQISNIESHIEIGKDKLGNPFERLSKTTDTNGDDLLHSALYNAAKHTNKLNKFVCTCC